MKKILSVLILSVFVTGCTTTGSNTTIPGKTTIVKVYPELPPINIPQGPKLYPFKFDVPRDKSKVIVKNLSDCINVPEEKRDENFWKKCGENPPLTDSNIFLGLDQENFNNLMLTIESMREYIIILKSIIEEINKQREEWRKENQKNLDKIQ